MLPMNGVHQSSLSSLESESENVLSTQLTQSVNIYLKLDALNTKIFGNGHMKYTVNA